MWRIAILLLLAAQQIPSITIAGDADAARLLRLSGNELARLRASGVLSRERTAPPVPDLFFTFPIPQSVKSNAEARAKLRAEGLTEREIGIGDAVGAFTTADNGYWFGKAVYNAEGESGRGGIGFLSKDGKYTMHDLPPLRTASVSAIAAEAGVIWVGMFHQGERARTARGLLRYDWKTGSTRTFALPGIIHTILPVDTRVFVGTNQGPYVLSDGTLTRLAWK